MDTNTNSFSLHTTTRHTHTYTGQDDNSVMEALVEEEMEDYSDEASSQMHDSSTSSR